MMTASAWLLDGAQLLSEPDPGPTPWLVEDLIVEGALVAVVGRWKTTKSYGVLDMCISIATGRPAFGVFGIPEPGPVVFINEESGKAALWRRLDALCRGRAIDPEELRGRLFVAPNMGVKLDDEGWQEELVRLYGLRPRLIAFDPLARMKAPARNESAQNEIAHVIEYLRTLRHETSAAVLFVHHTGHQGEHMRGSSDLESAWETRLRWKRDGQTSVVTVESEHREAEAAPPFDYRIAWDGLTRSMRFEAVEDDLTAHVREYLAEHPDASGNEVFKALGGNRAKVLALVKQVVPTDEYHPGTTPPRSEAEGGTPGALFREPGTTTADPLVEVVPEDGNHPLPVLGDDDFLPHLYRALERGLITEVEWHQGDRAHRLVVADQEAT